MKVKHCLFLLLILGALLACNDPKPVTDALHRAEALMNEHPDSAWAVLNTLSPDEMGQNRTRALYALLYTQAQDKTYRDETNDSLISIAVDYYRHTDDARRKFLSYYYKGRVHFNAKDYQNATLCYMEAEQLADEVGDDYLVGLLYAELGRIYDIYYDYPKSLEAYQKAAECYERAGKIRHRNYMWFNQSSVCRNMEQYDESERLLQMILKSGKEEKDSTLIRLVMGTMTMQYIEQKEMIRANSLYNEMRALVGVDFTSSSFMVALAKMYMAMGDLSQAEYYLEEAQGYAKNVTDSISTYMMSAELNHVRGKGISAYQELLKGIVLQNKETRQALQQPVLTAQRDYLSEKLEFEAYRLQMERHLRVLYTLFFVLLLVVVVFILRRKMKKVKEKAGKTIDELNRVMLQRDNESRKKVDSLLQQMEEQDKTTSASIHHLRYELQKQEEGYHRYMMEAEKLQRDLQSELQQKKAFVSELFKNWFEVMGMWVFLYEEKGIRENTRMKHIRKEIDLMKEKYMVGNKAFRELERLVNAYHDNAMLHFRHEVALADETDYRRVCYFFAGFSIPTIAWLMNEKIENVYQRRLRIRKLVASSSFTHKGLYILLLSK